jgi:mRNA-degrading endonuclease RelE of RelBE toxin-antitoxin system
MFTLEYTQGVLKDLKGLKTGKRKEILDKIEDQLSHTPAEETRNKKMLRGLKPPWQYEEPVWELRIGTYRVFYDVNQTDQRVFIRAVREKPPHKTTEDIL